MPPVPSQRPSPGQVPLILDGFEFDGDTGLAPFALGDVDVLVAAGPGGTPVAFKDGDVGGFAGGGVRPRFTGRLVCRVFW